MTVYSSIKVNYQKKENYISKFINKRKFIFTAFFLYDTIPLLFVLQPVAFLGN